jgi:UDP-N-acetylglucosamine:LPS N-acetylglucosamine transferase
VIVEDRVDSPQATAEELLRILSEIMGDPARLGGMKKAAGTVGHPEAASVVADALLHIR